MIVGREQEIWRFEAFLTGLRRGEGGGLAVHGAPGIGKTTLLAALTGRAGDEVTVLRVCGVQTEARLGFSALADLLAPVLDLCAALPAPQAAALLGALALGPPVPGARLAVCVAALGVLRAAAARRPVLVVVDDLHWVDAPSREVIRYAARRASGQLAVVTAEREPGPAPVGELRLGPLDDAAATALLRGRDPELAPAVVTALVRAAAGNPLALVGLPLTLRPGQRSGREPLDHPLGPGSGLRQVFEQRTSGLSEPARLALLVAAVHDGTELPVIASACRHIGTHVDRLGEAEARHLVRVGTGTVVFTHPLLRGLICQQATATDRRAAHAALAATLTDDRRPWHLAAATVRPDEHVAAELERVGRTATARRAFATGADALERAACLSPDRDEAGRRLILAAQAAAGAGCADRALTIVARAERDSDDPDQRARALHLRCRMLVWRGRATEAIALLVGHAGAVAARNPALAALMYADAACGANTTSAYREAERLARRGADLLGDRGDPGTRGAVLTMHGWSLLLRGKAPLAVPILREAYRIADGLDPLGPDWTWLHILRRTRISLGEFERAAADNRELSDRAEEAGAPAIVSGARLVLAEATFRLGDWDAADRHLQQVLRVAEEVGQPALVGYALCTRIRLLAARGEELAGRAAGVAASRIATSEDITSGHRFVRGALGFLELSLDRVAATIDELEVVRGLVDGSGLAESVTVPWAADLIEAYVRAGRRDDARRLLARFAGEAAGAVSPVVGAAAARCRGMVDDDFDTAFAQALALDDRRPMPFERARTLLAYGRRLHRARRRVAARERLREALGGFEQLRARAWADQTRAELRAAGARQRRAPADHALTAQESRVAAAVLRGASNRDIAADLYLSPKTVEFHLGRIYRKLNVHSRTQLVMAMRDGAG